MALKAENEQQVRNWKINRTPLGGDLAFSFLLLQDDRSLYKEE